MTALSNLTPEANKALVRAHYDAVTNRHDPEAIRAQLADDFYDHATGRRLSVEDTIAHSRLLHQTFAEFGCTIEDLVAEGDRVAARVTWHGVHAGEWRGIKPTGKRFRFTGMTFWRIREGRITDRWAEIDFAALEVFLKA